MAQVKKKSSKKKPPLPQKKTENPVALFSPRLVRGLGIALGIGILGSIILFISVDARVRNILTSPSSQFAGVYFAPVDFKAFIENVGSLPADRRLVIVKNELDKRGYSEAKRKGSEIHPGEYSVTGQIVTVRFQAVDLRSPPELKDLPVTLDLSRKTLQSGDSALANLELEPEVLSLRTKDIRASRFVPLAEIPLHVQQAVLATEDERFYSHFGLDLLGIARALFTNIVSGGLVQGGSTITQQLAKNVVLSPERSLKRKVLELFAALSLEARLSKKEILERYLNEVYLGQEGPVALHGFPEAAQSFFGKRVQDLTAEDAALLAGIIKAPSYFSPRRHLNRAIDRQAVVLGKMKELGFIAAKDSPASKPKVIHILPRSESGSQGAHFTHALDRVLREHVNQEAQQLAELRVETGLHSSMQQCAQTAVSKGLAKAEASWGKIRRARKPIEAGLVSIEPFSGLIRAWVGGRAYSQNQFDHVDQGNRQIGSTIKPFLYLTALDSSLNSYKVATAASILEDAPQLIETGRTIWEPENYDKDFRGDVTLRYALENSLNLPAVYVAERVGIPAIASTLEKFDLAHNIPNHPSLALGALDTSLLKLATAYGALANGGVYIKPRFFTRLIDKTGREVAQSSPEEVRVVDEASVFVLTDMLRGVVERGTAQGVRTLGFTRPAAGKTGTSDSTRDAWFIGYTPTLVTAVWVGFDDNKKLGLTGGQLAVPIWTEYMKCSAPYFSNADFVPPPTVVKERIDVQSGKIATRSCPSGNVINEIFVAGTEPRDECDEHYD